MAGLRGSFGRRSSEDAAECAKNAAGLKIHALPSGALHKTAAFWTRLEPATSVNLLFYRSQQEFFMAKIDAFFKLMHDQGASDLHLVSGQQPALRIRGDIERVKYNLLTDDDLRSMLYEIAPEDKVKNFEESGDIDFGYEIPGLARYRANFFMQKNG
ncbi:MAG: hypothetical protein WAV08_10810, partial [Desulfobacterales bacterium]